MLEVTEGVLIDNPDEAKARLDALKALGIRLALDDFGTGYSSLTYLQRFHFDKLKIDRGFVAPLGRDAGSQALVQAIVALGRALDPDAAGRRRRDRGAARAAAAGRLRGDAGLPVRPPGPREALDGCWRNAGPRARRRGLTVPALRSIDAGVPEERA